MGQTNGCSRICDAVARTGIALVIQNRFAHHAGGQTVRRSGGHGEELLVEGGFVKAQRPWERMCYATWVAILVRSPLAKLLGKSSLLAASFFP